MAVVVISEDWIRERVQIKHENLDNVRSLSLPGTYHEKISSFGDSLKHFCRLKSLDVSRNAIESLSGLENLKLLEKLNLYYNSIGSLDDLSKLHFNAKLQELDLRLNPVSRTEPDYRLFLVHMLPELRLLDDRAVRDTERKAALLHFSSDQAVQFTSHPERPQSPKQRPNPRVEHVKSLGKMQLYYAEDEALLSEMIRTGGDFSRKLFTGSVQKTPFSDDYPPEVIRQMNKGFLTSDTGDLPTTMKSYQDVQNDEVLGDDKGAAAAQFSQHCTGSAFGTNVDEIQSKYPNLYPFIISASDQSKSRDQSSSLNTNRMQNPNADASTEAVGHFTPNPAMFEKMEMSHKSPGMKQYVKTAGRNLHGVAGYEVETCKDGDSGGVDCLPQSQETLSPCPAAPRVDNDGSKSSDLKSLDCDDQLIIKISDLADKYWNGSKSLLKNQRFRNNITDLLHSIRAEQMEKTDSTGPGDPPFSAGFSGSSNLFLQRQLDQLRGELSRSRDENMRLHEKLVATTMDSGLRDDIGSGQLPPDETKLKSSLIKAQRDTSILQSRLEQVNEEKKALNDIIARLQATAPQQPLAYTKNQADIEMILTDNDRLRTENHLLKNRLSQSSTPMHELSSMLHDSHRSLVQTNEHLLQELNQLKRYRGDEKSRLQVSH